MAPQGGGTILVTGASGFLGRAVMSALRTRFPAARLVGISRKSQTPEDGIDWRTLDLMDAKAVEAFFHRESPDVVIHLAAFSSVGESFARPDQVWVANVDVTRRLAMAAAAASPAVAFIFASSAEVYGASFSKDEPTTEAACARPLTPYGRSKLAAELALMDCLSAQGRLVILRLFNHVGPGQGIQFMAASFASQLVEIERGLRSPVIEVGDLSPVRDFGDVEDAAAAFAAVVGTLDTLAPSAVFNVCSGRGRSVRSMLDMLIENSRAAPTVEVSPSRQRPIEVFYAVGSHAALTAATGWTPRGIRPEVIVRILEYWRKQVL